MPYENLADFLSDLHDDGELIRIAAEVDPILEVAEITDRVSRLEDGGPALLFENLKGSTFPVAVNLLGSERRICRALGVDDVAEVTNRVAGLIRPALPDGWLEKLKLLPQFSQLANLPPKIVASGLCQQVVKMGRDIDLGELPILQCRPQENARFITRGQIFTVDPETGTRHVGNYPLEIRDENSALIHWTPHDVGYQNAQRHRAQGKQMQVAVALGGDPLFDLMATLPLPPDSDPCLFGGFIRDKNIELVNCRSIDLQAPANAEIVLEGYLDATEESQLSQPFGSRTGFYSPPQPRPVLHVTALTHRANPVFPATIFGSPPQEEFWVNHAIQRIFHPLIRLFIPDVVAINLPRAGASRNLCFVSIRKTYPYQARKVMNAIWSLNQLMYSKIVVVVDESVDVHDEQQVWFQVGANIDPQRDVVMTDGPSDYLDHATAIPGVGQKMGIDATRKLPEEGHPRPWPDAAKMSAEIQDLVTRRWSEYHIDIDSPGSA